LDKKHWSVVTISIMLALVRAPSPLFVVAVAITAHCTGTIGKIIDVSTTVTTTG